MSTLHRHRNPFLRFFSSPLTFLRFLRHQLSSLLKRKHLVLILVLLSSCFCFLLLVGRSIASSGGSGGGGDADSQRRKAKIRLGRELGLGKNQVETSVWDWEHEKSCVEEKSILENSEEVRRRRIPLLDELLRESGSESASAVLTYLRNIYQESRDSDKPLRALYIVPSESAGIGNDFIGIIKGLVYSLLFKVPVFFDQRLILKNDGGEEGQEGMSMFDILTPRDEKLAEWMRWPPTDEVLRRRVDESLSLENANRNRNWDLLKMNREVEKCRFGYADNVVGPDYDQKKGGGFWSWVPTWFWWGTLRAFRKYPRIRRWLGLNIDHVTPFGGAQFWKEFDNDSEGGEEEEEVVYPSVVLGETIEDWGYCGSRVCREGLYCGEYSENECEWDRVLDSGIHCMSSWRRGLPTLHLLQNSQARDLFCRELELCEEIPWSEMVDLGTERLVKKSFEENSPGMRPMHIRFGWVLAGNLLRSVFRWGDATKQLRAEAEREYGDGDGATIVAVHFRSRFFGAGMNEDLLKKIPVCLSNMARDARASESKFLVFVASDEESYSQKISDLLDGLPSNLDFSVTKVIRNDVGDETHVAELSDPHAKLAILKDFYMLSKADIQLLSAASTFAWWGYALGNGRSGPPFVLDGTAEDDCSSFVSRPCPPVQCPWDWDNRC